MKQRILLYNEFKSLARAGSSWKKVLALLEHGSIPLQVPYPPRREHSRIASTPPEAQSHLLSALGLSSVAIVGERPPLLPPAAGRARGSARPQDRDPLSPVLLARRRVSSHPPSRSRFCRHRLVVLRWLSVKALVSPALPLSGGPRLRRAVRIIPYTPLQVARAARRGRRRRPDRRAGTRTGSPLAAPT